MCGAVMVLLTGLQWLSLKPREMQPVSVAEGVGMGADGRAGGRCVAQRCCC